MMIIFPFAMNISMAERTFQELGSPYGITQQKSDGLPSPERSGSPELNTRSSQWKRDRMAYASKEDAHQIDDWPEARNRKSEDVLVRYKDTRGSKCLDTGMDPHAWSDLPTDTDDDIADNATSPVWSGAHGVGFSPKSGRSKAELDISIQQLITKVPRNSACVKKQSELVNLHYFASEDHWETVASDGVSRQDAGVSDAEREGGGCNTALPTSVASSQNDLRAACYALEGEKVPTQRNIPGRLSQKSLDEQASMKMSHRYYTSGVDSSRRRSIPSRKDAEIGKEDNVKHCGRKRCEGAETDFKSNIRKSSTNDADSVKELAESSSSDDSGCSDAEFLDSRHGDENVNESLREMILQKYLVMLPGKAKELVRTSADTKQKEGRCKSQATPDSQNKKLSRKNLHSVSPSRRQRFKLRKSPKKIPYSSAEATLTRTSVSQPAESLQANTLTAKVAPREEDMKSRNASSLVAFLKKSWSTGDLHHSKSLGDIATLKGCALAHREVEKSLPEQQKRTIDVKLRLTKDSEASPSDASQTLPSSDRCFAMEKKVVEREETTYPQLTTEGLHNFTNLSIRSVEVSTTVTANLPVTKISNERVSCGCLNSVMQGSSKTQLNIQHCGPIEEAEHEWHGHVTKQGLSALALFPGSAETSKKSLKSSADDSSVAPIMPAGGPTEEGGEGSQWIHEHPMSKEHVKLYCKGAKDSSDCGSTHRSTGKQVKGGDGPEEARNGFCKPKSLVKKVTAVVPIGSCGGDQVLPDVSLAGEPASHTRLELQREVEPSKHSVTEERRQRERIKQQTSPEQSGGSEKLAQQRRGLWDASQELQKEKQTLSKRLQELEAHHPCNRLKAMSGTKVQLTDEDAKRLRQEILEQEALIRGYQVENEKAVAKLREVQLEAKQKLQEMADEKAHLASQLVNRQMLGYGTDSASLQEKLKGALSRETALRIDLDKMRDSFVDLEKRGRREESSRVKDLELKLSSLQETLEAERQSHSQMEGRKQAMIQQEELIASLQETIADQASKIRSLTSRMEAGEDRKDAQTQIGTLQNQVKRLEASLRTSKKETGLHALQVAKSGMEENETFRRLQTELLAVQRNALQRDEETNRIIHHLRVENDKIKHESATRIRNLNHQIQAQAKSGHSISESELSAVNRVKDLEKQVANLRIHYSRKVKELTDKLEESKPVDVISRSKTNPDNMGPPPRVAATRLQPAQGKALREAKERIALQEDVISQKDRTIKSLQKQIQALETNGAGSTEVPTTEDDTRAKPAARAVQSSGSGGTRKQGSPTATKGSTRPHSGSNGIPNDDASADEVAELRRELQKSELTREVLQKTCNESVEKTVWLTLQHQQALQLHQIRQSQMNHQRPAEGQTTLTGAHTSSFAGWGDSRSGLEGMNWLSEQSSLEMTNRALEARLKVMAEELEDANTMSQQSPRMTQIMNLKKKVAEMEARQQQKELEWQKILQDTRQSSSMEQEYAERKWQEALNSKSMEVEKIRLELNTILEAAMAMQHAQLQMNHKSDLHGTLNEKLIT